MIRKLLLTVVSLLFIAIVFTQTTQASQGEGNCRDKTLSVSNQVSANLWYTQDGGNCAPLRKHRTFNVNPGEQLKVFSDMTCETNYCMDNIPYKDIESYDSNGDYRVRILPGCVLSDM